jgi:pyruvate dehydrogenase E2 component (dihydrolipoamide acetyltransferase)
MGQFKMPSLGADMEAGKLVEWRIKPGDTVARGDVVAVVETQKGAIEIEIFETGVVRALLAEIGQTLPVGAPLAEIGGNDTQAPAQAPVITPPTKPAPAAPPASPAARAEAQAAGLNLADIHGSGPDGAVLLADVTRHLATAKPGPAPRRGLDMAAMRTAIAAAMERSKREIPHYYLSHSIDLHAATSWLTATNAARAPEERVLIGALFLRAMVCALAKTPELNGHYLQDRFVPSACINAGLVVALRGGGLMAPCIRDAQDMPLLTVMAAMRDLVARTRSGGLRNSELTDGTITLSSMGEAGAEALFGVIYPPQVAIVGFGAPQIRPWALANQIVARPSVTATLSADHRVSDGRRGARLLTEIDRLLQEPEAL